MNLNNIDSKQVWDYKEDIKKDPQETCGRGCMVPALT
jgi:hypothetical protein